MVRLNKVWNGNFNTNHGAMFGLDARIALAIFGALSVIAGASLSQTMQTLNAEKYKRYLEETVKAHEQFYLDTGSKLPITLGVNGGSFRIDNLLRDSDGVAGWNGPYLQGYARLSATKISFILEGTNSRLSQNTVLHTSNNWGNHSGTMYCVTGDGKCNVWHKLGSGYTEDKNLLTKVFYSLDKSIDNEDGEKAGKIRFRVGELYYLGMAYPEF